MKKKQTKKKRMMTSVLSVLAIAGLGMYFSFNLLNQRVNAETIMVYKSPTCGCCTKWVTYLRKEGFDVQSKDLRDMNPIKQKFGVKRQFQSCHTAKVGKYFVEGHVTASDIKKLLNEKPDIKGIAAPGMPMGSPGMEGHRKDRYDVLAIDNNNNTTVFSRH